LRYEPSAHERDDALRSASPTRPLTAAWRRYQGS
jgi:hypothetical protein